MIINNNTITSRLLQAQSRLAKRGNIRLILLCSGIASLFLLLLEGIERLYPFTESLAFYAVTVILAASFIVLITGILKNIFSGRNPANIARIIEDKHPELMDSLICAVEKESLDETSRRILEKALVVKASEETKNMDFFSETLPRKLYISSLFATAPLAIFMVVAALHTRILLKTEYHLMSILGMLEKGLEIIPGDTEVAIHENLKIETRIARWGGPAEIIYSGKTGRFSCPMTKTGDSVYVFNFYDLSEDTDYRIVTPSLESRMFNVRVYRPPQIKAAVITVTPPAYTRQPLKSFRKLENISTLKGSELKIEINSQGAENVFFVDKKGKKKEFSRIEKNSHSYEFRLEKTEEFSILLSDAAGHEIKTAPVKLEALPDLPPVIEVVKPEKDITVPPESSVEFNIKSADDFGISEIRFIYTISGTMHYEIRLTDDKIRPVNAPFPTALDIATQLNLKDFNIKEQDIVSCYFTVSDICEPEKQLSRSEIIFIEVRPEPEQMQCMGKMEELDIYALIAELKRLIRLTYDASGAPEGEGEKLQIELDKGIADLRVAAVLMMDKVLKATGLNKNSDNPVVISFKDTISKIEKAENLIRKKILEESITYQEQALAVLTSLAHALMKNQSSSSSGEGSGGGKEDNKNGSEKKQKSLKELLDFMAQMLSELKMLSDRQAALNSSLSIPREQNGGLEKSEIRELVEKQNSIKKDVLQVNKSIQDELNAQRVKYELDNAGNSMSATVAALEKSQIAESVGSGRNAQIRLMSALELFQQTIRQIAALEIEKLASKAEQLSESESVQAGKSGKAASSPDIGKNTASEMKVRQDKLAGDVKYLTSMTESAAVGMEQIYPQASNALKDAASKAKTGGLDSVMKRASNALLYNKFGRASEFQKNASGMLSKIAEDLKSARKFIPRISREEIIAALKKIRQTRNMLTSLSGGDRKDKSQLLKKSVQDSGTVLGKIGQELNDMELTQFGAALEHSMENADPEKGISESKDILDAAELAMMKHIMKSEISRRVNLNRKISVPPKKYKSLVEEYFKSLSE